MTQRMSGYDAFVKMADIREDFVNEAYLPALFPSERITPKKKLLAPLWGFLGSHAVAAALCGVLVLGVIAATVGLSPLNPFRDPPVTQPPVTDTAEPDTPPVSESESETQPEEEIGEPYELVYTSLGDGTCKVSDIVINPKYHEKFDLTIPATSPDGERVVAVENPGGFGYPNVPRVLLLEDYEVLLYRIRTHYGRDSMTVRRFESYYIYKNVDNCSTENLKKDLLNAYPWAAVTDFYILDEVLVEEVELVNLGLWIAEAAPDYLAYEAEKRISDLVSEQGMTLTWNWTPTGDRKPLDVENIPDNALWVDGILLADGIETIGERAFGLVRATSVTLPAGLTEIGDLAFYYCRNITEIKWPQGTLRRIGENAFTYCIGITELSLTGDGLVIGSYAFRHNVLTSVSLGAGVVEVGDQAFCESFDLERLYLGDDVTLLGEGAFSSQAMIRVEFGENSRLSRIKSHGFSTLHPDTVLPRSLTLLEQYSIYGDEVSFAGTMAEWEAIEKHEEWFYEPITVHCADGDLVFGLTVKE